MSLFNREPVLLKSPPKRDSKYYSKTVTMKPSHADNPTSTPTGKRKSAKNV